MHRPVIIVLMLAVHACASGGSSTAPEQNDEAPTQGLNDAASTPARSAKNDDRASKKGPAVEWRSALVDSSAGARITYYTTGAVDGRRPPLVVVSGGPGSDHRYMRIGGAFARLSRTRPVVMFDQRSTGASTAAGDRPEFKHWADDVEAIRAALGAPRIDLLGHSFGGLVAMAYAQAYGERLRALVLVDSSAPKLAANKQLLADVYPDRIDKWRAIRAALPPKFAAPEIAVFFSMEFVDPTLATTYKAEVSAFTYDISVNNALRAELRSVDFTPTLRRLPVPALIVHGRQDAVLAPAVAFALAEVIPQSTLRFIDGSGHLPFVERPGVFAQTVASFLEQVAMP